MKTNASLDIRRSAQRQRVSEAQARDHSPAADGGSPPFSGLAVARFGDWRGAGKQVAGTRSTDPGGLVDAGSSFRREGWRLRPILEGRPGGTKAMTRVGGGEET